MVILPNFCYKPQNRISDIEIKEDDIRFIIKNVNPKKAHGWDDVSIHMIQLCGKSIVKTAKYLFESSLTAGAFPEDWKKANIIPVHKKESRNCLNNYRPISLLPKFCKIFERLIFNALFNYFVKHQLFTDEESKNCLNNYRPISLLPTFCKIFERLIFNALFNYFVKHQLFTDYQSGFI